MIKLLMAEKIPNSAVSSNLKDMTVKMKAKKASEVFPAKRMYVFLAV